MRKGHIRNSVQYSFGVHRTIVPFILRTGILNDGRGLYSHASSGSQCRCPLTGRALISPFRIILYKMTYQFMITFLLCVHFYVYTSSLVVSIPQGVISLWRMRICTLYMPEIMSGAKEKIEYFITNMYTYYI